MRKISLLSFVVGLLVVVPGLVDEVWADRAPKRPYQYVSLDEAVPEGFFFFDAAAITDSGRVYVTLLQCDPDCLTFVAVYHRGEMTVLHEGFAVTGNNRGQIGGAVNDDMGLPQAALFTRSEVELLPRLPDEFLAAVIRLTNSGIALVESLDPNFNGSYYLTKHDHVTPLNFGPDPARHFDINDRGIISGTSSRPEGDRAFRYDPSSGNFTVLEPLPTELESRGQAINNRGDVLGYSFVFDGLERIGVWRGTEFRTYFVEGTPEVPTLSNRLLWNERGLIVITDTDPADLGSYLVPRPGVRLNLADLTEGPLPVWTLIIDINNRGDLIGIGGPQQFFADSAFLLRRVGPLDGKGGDVEVVAASSLRSAGGGARHASALERVHDELLERWLGKGRAEQRKDVSDE